MPGFRFIEVPADADGPAVKGAMWYPCSEPPGEITLDSYTLSVVKDCPISGDGLPLVVVSHGNGGFALNFHDTAETLANAGFVVAAINHPGDKTFDMSRFLSAFVAAGRYQAADRFHARRVARRARPADQGRRRRRTGQFFLYRRQPCGSQGTGTVVGIGARRRGIDARKHCRRGPKLAGKA
jgi:hypothetical protein